MIEIFLLIFAGLFAGLVTGFFGGSAVLSFVPIMVILAGYNPYIAVGIGLGVDVFASLTAFFIYHKNKRVNIKPAVPLLIFALIGVFIGSFFSVNIPSKNLSFLIGIGICLTSIKFFKEIKLNKTKILNDKLINLVFIGLIIGLILGIFGGGGGLIILLILTLVLGYKIHSAIGTSVLIMIFVAFFGSVSHYIYMPFSIYLIFIGAIGGVIGAFVSSKFANSLNEKKLNKIIGCFLLIFGFCLIFFSIGIF